MDLFSLSAKDFEKKKNVWTKDYQISKQLHLEISNAQAVLNEKYPYFVTLKIKGYTPNVYYFYLDENFEVKEFGSPFGSSAPKYVSCVEKENGGIKELAELLSYSTECSKETLAKLKSEMDVNEMKILGSSERLRRLSLKLDNF